MNKQLLTLAGLLSLLAANQAFGWEANIKNETASKQDIILLWYRNFSESSRVFSGQQPERLSIPAGGTISINSNDVYHLRGFQFRPGTKMAYSTKINKDGKVINPLKGLTLKTVNGQTVVVENP